MDRKTIALVLVGVGAFILLVAGVSLLVYPGWPKTPQGLVSLIVAAAVGGVVFIKGILDILKAVQGLRQPESETSHTPQPSLGANPGQPPVPHAVPEMRVDTSGCAYVGGNAEAHHDSAGPDNIAYGGEITGSSRALRVFLCHSSNDKVPVRELYRRLLADNTEPWLDEVKILPGQDWHQEITRAVRAADVVIVCLSRGSISKVGYVQKEISYALDVADEQPEGTLFLIPLKLEECEVPERLRRWQWVNYFEESGYRRLADSLRSRAGTLGTVLPVASSGSQQSGDDDTVSVLFLAADPTDASRLRVDEEFREIQEKLRLAKLRERFRLELPRLSVRSADISQALLGAQPRIVHFSGHGASTGALCFEDAVGQAHLVQPAAIAALFEQFADQVKCVVLNACFSEVQAEAIAQHIESVIGMSQQISDKAATAFAIGFYQALGAGRTTEDAFKLGCVQIRLQGIPEHLTPVLRSFALSILRVLNRRVKGGRTARGISDDTQLDESIVRAQLEALLRDSYVAVDRTNGERWTITPLGGKRAQDLPQVPPSDDDAPASESADDSIPEPLTGVDLEGPAPMAESIDNKATPGPTRQDVEAGTDRRVDRLEARPQPAAERNSVSSYASTSDLNRSHQLESDKPWALGNRGETHRSPNHYNAALADLNRSLELEPNDAFALTSRGETYRLVGQYDNSLTDLNRSLQLKPDDSWALSNRGETHRLLKRYSAALADLSRALQMEPDNAFALRGRGETYRMLGQLDAALADLNRALQLEPNNAFALTSRGATYRMLGQLDAALTDLDRALQLEPASAWALSNRGETHRLLNR